MGRDVVYPFEMPKIRPETAAKRRLKILEAAHRAFNTHGINVSVDQICAEAGVSKGNFYGYFDSKDEVILEIAREHGKDIRLLGQIDGIDALADRLLSYSHRGNVPASRFELEAWTYSLTQSELRAIFQRNLVQIDQALGHTLLQQEPDHRVGKAMPAAEAAQLLRIFAVGLMATNALDDAIDTQGLKDGVRSLVALLVNATRGHKLLE